MRMLVFLSRMPVTCLIDGGCLHQCSWQRCRILQDVMSAVLIVVLAFGNPATAADSTEPEKTPPADPAAKEIPMSTTQQRGEFDNYLRAQQLLTALREQGRTVSLLREPVQHRGEAVQLTFYQLYDAAEWSARRLQREGFIAWVNPERETYGYIVQAGIYHSKAESQAAITRLRELGHANIRVRQLSWTGYRYLVQETVDPNRVPDDSGPDRAINQVDAIGQAEEQTDKPEAEQPGDDPDSFNFAGSGGDDDTVLAFGTQTDYDALLVQSQHKPAASRHNGFRFDELRVELGSLDASEGGVVESSHAVRARFGYGFQIGDNIDGRLAARYDGAQQGPERQLSSGEWEPDEAFLRYRHGEHKWTVGAVTINWGTLDELAPGNVIARQDLTRFVLDDLSQRYRAQTVLRYEGWFERYKLDVVAIPLFEPAALPEADSIWSPFDQSRGLLLNVEPNPVLATLLQNGTVDTDPIDSGPLADAGHGGGGIRLSHQGQGLDWGVSVQHVRHSTPYLVLDEAVRSTLLLTGDPIAAIAATTAPTFAAWHPFTDVLSADVTFNWSESTWRGELACLSDFPATTPDLRPITAPACQYGVGVEFYPGDGNTRFSLQAGGMQLQPDEAITDREQLAFLSGELEMLLFAESWRLRLRFLGTDGEGRADSYVNPELAYVRAEPDEFYLGVHVFDGDVGTAGGYHEEHDMMVLGWRGQF